MKKRYSIILLVMLFLFASCGVTVNEAGVDIPKENTESVSDTSDATDDNNDTSTSNEVVQAAVEIEKFKEKHSDKTVVTCLVDIIGPTYWEEVEDKINNYLDSLGSDLAVYFIRSHGSLYANYPDMVNTFANSGVQVDILAASFHYSTDAEENNFHRDVILGLLEPLDDYFETSESGRSFYDSMPDNYFEGFRVDGKIYSVSGEMLNQIGGFGYSVDKDLADKYGFDANEPIIAQLDTIEAAVKGEADIVGASIWNYGMADNYPDRFDRWAGVCWDYENDRVAKITDNEKYLEGLKLLYALNERGLLDYGQSSLSSACFVSFGLQYYCGENSEVAPERYRDSISERISVIGAEPKISNVYNSIGISSDSEYKAEAFEMLMYLQNDPYINNLLAYGPEGEEYTLENGRAVVDLMQFGAVNFYTFANLAVCYPYGRYSDTINQDYMSFYETAEAVPYLGFAFDVRPVAEEYKAVKNAIEGHAFMNYDTPEESMSALDQKLTEAGIDIVIEEINRQYNEWKENYR